ncbi:ribosome maturation factor RimM [Boudabousia marimammalium]|uniref:Ribosome maturation factor RimM n=1 Tax=Boudabousia marimammalium TaxID=156892 RepID=A0A1Q5PR74_9ACTO|nr:ribosome maturation factor RimM [Boudabousia marimammalium]OKL50131.1 16S rRNA processing protein RimM [Boudabousia marimammalium]
MEVTVAIIGSAVGLRGHVRLDMRTDQILTRFEKGSVLHTDPAEVGPLTVQGLRKQGTKFIVAFAEVTDRNAAEALRGVRLTVDSETDEDDEGFYPHQLRGLDVVDLEGKTLGVVKDLEFGLAQERLLVTTPDGEEVAVPFVHALVPEVDLEAAKIVLDPPGGLFPAETGAEG